MKQLNVHLAERFLCAGQQRSDGVGRHTQRGRQLSVRKPHLPKEQQLPLSRFEPGQRGPNFFPGFAAVWKSWRSILYIGIPSGLVNVAIPVGLGFITRLVAGYGAAAVAGFGVASRIETFALTVVGALRSVLCPFIGQNWGASRHDRVREAVGLSNRFVVAWGGLLLVAFAIVESTGYS